jgi:hypothetical protein
MSQSNEPKEVKKLTSNYAKYSGIAFQMLGTIGLGVYAGLKLDEWLKFKFPLFTLVLSLGSVGASLYLMIKQVKSE